MSRDSSEKIPAAASRQLGKRFDSEIAREFGLDYLQVQAEWRRRGIDRHRKVNWTPARIKLLGTMPDAELARRIKFAKNVAFKKRKELGISPFGQSTDDLRHRWTKRQLAMLGKVLRRTRSGLGDRQLSETETFG